MAYDPPTQGDLRSRVATDLRDPNMGAFTVNEVDGFINDGIVELNQIRPIEEKASITDVAGLDTLDLTYVWKVVVQDLDEPKGSTVIAPSNEETKYPNGWQFYGGSLILPPKQVDWLDDAFTANSARLDVYGYRNRDGVVIGADGSDLVDLVALVDEMLIRRYSRVRAWDSLLGDRALFQQWLAQANNTDVSPTQLMNMAQVASADWDRQRKRNLLIRRPSVGW